MKTSNLIEQLQNSLKENGDLEVHIFSDFSEETENFGGISVLMGKDDKPIELNLCGPETLLAFTE